MPQDTKEEKKRVAQYWKSLWRWNGIVKPGFKLMPVNEVKKQFIRIDKKSLVELGLSNIYTMPMRKDIESTLKDDDFEKKANHIKMIIDKNITMFKKLSSDGNKKLQSRNCYIHVSTNEEKKTPIAVELEIITKDELDKRDDNWFFRTQAV